MQPCKCALRMSPGGGRKAQRCPMETVREGRAMSQRESHKGRGGGGKSHEP